MNHVLVTGGAGFLGSHLCRALLARGDRVTAVDNLGTGRLANIADLTTHPRFALRTTDTTALGCFADLDRITHLVHLAYPGSPESAARYSAAALRSATTGTLAALDLATAHRARVILGSGPDPEENPLEHIARRVAHIHAAGHRLIESGARASFGTDIAVARLFDVYGPGLWPGDGRISATICAAAYRDQSLYFSSDRTLYPVYVSDAVDRLLRLLDDSGNDLIEIGGPAVSLTHFAHTAVSITGRGWLDIHPAADGLGGHPHSKVPDAGSNARLIRGLSDTLGWMRSVLPGSATVPD